ncbi:MAG TPA: hypothetical protein VNJ01_01115 [Bacteriovoracaceae bacterium]|nr:hypothetical protein [Bacteriovoracaceae bacterium]
MMNKDFLEFLTNSDGPPDRLRAVVKKDIQLSFRKTGILSRFVLLQMVGAVVSLAFCPQFGLGFSEGHGIGHYFRMFGDLACAFFCASLFLSCGALITVLGMKSEELWWTWRRYKLSLFLFPSALWFLLMLANLSLRLPPESSSYHLTWVVVAVLVQATWLKLSSLRYEKVRLFSAHRSHN